MSKRGRPKEANSIRGKGLTYIAVDKPCREDLKELARINEKTLSGYLRDIAEKEGKKAKQKLFPAANALNTGTSQSSHALMRVIDNLSVALAVKLADSIQFIGDTEEQLDNHIKLLTWAVSAEYAQSRLAGAKELLKIRQEQIAQKDQIALPLTTNLNLKEAK